MSSSYVWAPLGASEAAAGVMAAMFFAGAVVCLVHLKTSNFKLYMEGGALAAIFRGVSLALKAGSIRRGDSNAAMTILSLFFAGAGFGMAISMQLFILAGWLRNTADDAKPAPWRPLRLLLLAVFFPCIIVFGPILGLTSALVQYASVPPSQYHVDVALKLRKTSSTGMLIITGVMLLIVLWSLLTAVRARATFSLRRHASHLVVWLVPGSLLLIWAAAFRVQANWVRPSTLNDEPLAYPLQVLPELLQLYLVWCLPTVAARVHLSDRFQVWWEEGHAAGVPPFGGYTTEPQPLPSWVAEEQQQQRKAAGGKEEADVESGRPPSPGVDAVVTVQGGSDGRQQAVPPLARA